MPSNLLATIGELSLIEPRAALDYFSSLIPLISPGEDPGHWYSGIRRSAFQLVGVMEQTLIERIHKTVYEAIRTGDQDAPQKITDLLDEMGVGPKDDSYSEMVWRTECMSALNQGAEDEILNDPEMQEAFPVWELLGIQDGREGPDHRPNFGHVFPNSMTFNQVRGRRVWRCRCARVAIHRDDWEQRQRHGKELTTYIPRERAGFR